MALFGLKKADPDGLLKLWSKLEALKWQITGLLIALFVGLLVNGIYAIPFIGGVTILFLIIRR